MTTMDADELMRDRYRSFRVCSECIGDADLRAYITSSNGEPGCSFCNEEDAPTCTFLDFMDHVSACIDEGYDWAVDCLPWDSEEDKWLWGPVWDTYDLIFDELEIGFEREGNESLMDAMIDYLGPNEWCVKDPYGEDPLEALRHTWQEFCKLTKHRTRFFLDRWPPPSSNELGESPSPPTPAMMLYAIGDRINRMELFRAVRAGSTVYRARYCERDQWLRTPQELGPPPLERAVVANRMSPSGIVMFYAALDSQTALLETAVAPGRFAVGEFRVLRDLCLLDLTEVPDAPGFFASIPDSRPWGRVDARFFGELVRDLTRPIARDDRLHIEYIPTQVVTEYCRLSFHHEHNTSPLDGIVYPSARNFGRPALVLFAGREGVVGNESTGFGVRKEPWLELNGVEHFEGTESFRFSPIKVPYA